jgi:hypothetical protein
MQQRALNAYLDILNLFQIQDKYVFLAQHLVVHVHLVNLLNAYRVVKDFIVLDQSVLPAQLIVKVAHLLVVMLVLMVIF